MSKAFPLLLIALSVLCGHSLNAEELVTPETMELWPEGAPGAKGDEAVDRPVLTIYQPSVRYDNKAAVVICPGGGYGGHAMGHEGAEIAGWLNSLRMTAFVLRYRLAPHYQHPAPKQDVLRAIQHVRAHAKEFGVDPNKVGVLGFSAGGHLASTAATQFAEGDPQADDVVARQSSRPDFAVLCYPVISMKEEVTHGGSRRNLLGAEPTRELVNEMSNETRVTEKTPPTFLFHTSEDTAVKPLNSLLFYQAMLKHNVPGELHVFQTGRHGVGLGKSIPGTRAWSVLVENWFRANGWIE